MYEGSFRELAELDRVRREHADDRAAVDELARSSANWTGRVWADAQLFVAEAYVGRFRDPARGAGPALSVGRSSADPVQRGAGWDLAYSALRSDLDRAAAEIANDPRAPEPIRARVRRDLRRRSLHRASTAIAGGGGGLLIFSLATAAKRGRLALVRQRVLQPIALAFLLVLPLFGGLLANAWDPGLGRHFVPLGLALVFVHVLAATFRGAFGDRAASVRAMGGLAAAMCVLAAAYLILERGEAYGTPLLEGFGL